MPSGRRRSRWASRGCAVAIAALWCAHADAQGPLPRSGADHRPRATVVAPPATGLETTSDLRAHFGLDLVERLLRSQDPEDRLRGIERAASLGTPEAMARLIDAVDAEADNRGELLFELRGAGQRQFALYRVTRGSAEQMFATVGIP